MAEVCSSFSGAAARDFLRRLFQHVLQECAVDRALPRRVNCERGILRFGDDLYFLPDHDQVLVVSIGKAAHAMAEALAAQTGEIARGIVAGIGMPETRLPGFQYFAGGHPLPNQDSLRAAEAILNLLNDATQRSLVIFLISGGGSSLVELPVAELSFPDLSVVYAALVHSGAPIAQVNAIRKHLSAIKGGRLAQAAAPAQQVTGMIVDVPDNALDSLASGPTMPDSTTVEHCYAIAAQYDLLPQFPPAARALFAERTLPETPKDGDPAFAHSRWTALLSNSWAVRAAAEFASGEGFRVEVDNLCDDWDWKDAAEYLVKRLKQLRRKTDRLCLLSGGEVTVKVTKGGIGGRNQQFALYCATLLDGGRPFAVLSAGTDGVDGNSPAAGAVVDAHTVTRARELRLDPAAALAAFDSFPLLTALGDTIITGPTGNNIRDLRALLTW